jgi:hypothetical protein
MISPYLENISTDKLLAGQRKNKDKQTKIETEKDVMK